MAQEGKPVEIKWDNRLPGKHFLPVDETIHLASPARGGIPTVTHLHGGHTESASDGLPEAWFTRNFKEVGAHFVKEVYRYDNDQEGATLWYHDHALGITRLNVYAGLAGFYLLRNANEMDLIGNNLLPGGPYEREIVIQDRMFDTHGQLHLPAGSEDEEEAAAFSSEDEFPEPSVVAEFFGDHNLVNGVIWPKLDVEPRSYRLRLLNGSDSRFFGLKFNAEGSMTNLPFYQIGTDDGFLPQAVPLTELVIGPGERADLIFDFSDALLFGQRIILRNTGPDAPFRGLNPDGTNSDGEGGVLPAADPATTGLVMAFDVTQPLSPVPDAFDASLSLRPGGSPFTVPGDITTTRQLVLFEGEDQFGRLRPQLGIYQPGHPLNGSLLWDEAITENPGLGDVEEWEIFNATEDAHPIHLHLVTFQVLNRQAFDGFPVTVGSDPKEGGTKQVLQLNGLIGIPFGPLDNEKGPKDTVQMFPAQVTRIKARFDRPGRYVWHCHILSHEDHEMMRPYHVG
jgi:spore coat protein A